MLPTRLGAQTREHLNGADIPLTSVRDTQKIYSCMGWSGGAKVLGKLPVPRRPTILIKVGQGSTALAVGAGGVVWAFLLSSILPLLFPTLWETAQYRL